MMKSKNKLYWYICVVLAIVNILFTFSPWVMTYGSHTPLFSGVPFTLWLTIITSLNMVILTFLGSKFLLKIKTDKEE